MRDYEPEKMKKSPLPAYAGVMARANQLEAEGESIIHFEVGQPDFVTPKYIRDAACVSFAGGNTRYTSNYGNLALRKAISAKLEKENHIFLQIQKAEIMVTVGGEEAMAAAVLALVDAGDEVLLTDPGYSPYDSMVKIANGIPVYVSLDESRNFNF